MAVVIAQTPIPRKYKWQRSKQNEARPVDQLSQEEGKK